MPTPATIITSLCTILHEFAWCFAKTLHLRREKALDFSNLWKNYLLWCCIVKVMTLMAYVVMTILSHWQIGQGKMETSCFGHSTAFIQLRLRRKTRIRDCKEEMRMNLLLHQSSMTSRTSTWCRITCFLLLIVSSSRRVDNPKLHDFSFLGDMSSGK